MSNSIVITLPHRLGAEEAKRRIAGGIELCAGIILAALTGKIQGVLKTKAEESLRIAYTPPKT
jgi:hypothetical protein